MAGSKKKEKNPKKEATRKTQWKKQKQGRSVLKLSHKDGGKTETKDTPGRSVIKQKMNSDTNEGGTNTKEVRIQRSTRNNNLQNKTGTIQ